MAVVKKKALTQKQYEYLTERMQAIADKWVFSRLFLTFPKEAILDRYNDSTYSSYYDSMLNDFNENRVKKTYELIDSVVNLDTSMTEELSLIDVNKGRLLHSKRVDFSNTLDRFMHIRQDLYTIALQYLSEELCANDKKYNFITFEELNKDIIGE